ncbi:MAG: hypothetical protein QM723_00460 [Myxococcaceae bacterium]
MNDVEARARRSYEWGRAWFALRHGLLVLPLLGCSLFGCGKPAWAAASGLALFSLVSLLQYKGGALAKVVVPSVAAGLVPMTLPMLAKLSGHVCGGMLCGAFTSTCAVGGVLAGAWVGRRLAHAQSLKAIGAGLALAALTGALGCAAAGLSGVLGMALGLALGATPAVLLARRG